jgi:hypothetical protein
VAVAVAVAVAVIGGHTTTRKKKTNKREHIASTALKKVRDP